MKKIYILAGLFALLPFVSSAEEPLTKEIVVEKDYIPTEQKATRLNSTPEVKTITIESEPIEFSNWSVPTATGNQIPVLKPYGYQTTRNFNANRGYADFGIGSYWNITGNAGYKLVDTGSTSLNFWVQHNSTWGGHNGVEDAEYKTKFLDDVAGLDFTHVNGYRKFEAGAYYHFGRLNYLPVGGVNPYNNINEFNIAARYSNLGNKDVLNYYLGFRFNTFGNDLKAIEMDNWYSEYYANLAGGLSVYTTDDTQLGLGAVGEMFSYKDATLPETRDERNTMGKLRLTPYLDKTNDKVNFHAGVNVDISFSDGATFRFSPDVKLSYNFADAFGAFVQATGGKTINRVADLYTVNRYVTPLKHIESVSSYTPFDVNLGFRIGSVSGFRAKLWGGYGKTKDAVMAKYGELYLGENLVPMIGTSYLGYDIKGFYVGAELAYAYNNLFEVEVKGQYAKQDEDKGYAGMGMDRPKFVLNAKLEVKPIEKLRLSLKYEMRADRAEWQSEKVFVESSGQYIYGFSVTELEDVNNLSLSANYQFNDMLGFFADFNNILNKRWETTNPYFAQKFNVMGGVNLKF